jgi:hypothetical protein
MKRSALVRKAPMPRGKVELKRTTPLKRSPFRPTPKNDYEKDLDRVRPTLHQRSKGLCEIRLPGCQGIAVHPHHRKLRSRGGSNDLSNLLDVCGNCHDWAHANPELATALGLQVPSGMPVGPVEEVFVAVAEFVSQGLTTRYERA